MIKNDQVQYSITERKRFHEQDYATKVISSNQADKNEREVIQLSESLFNAKFAANHSQNLIRNLTKEVKQKIKKYDSLIKINHSLKQSTEIRQSTPQPLIYFDEDQVKESNIQLINDDYNKGNQRLSCAQTTFHTDIKSSNKQSRKPSSNISQSPQRPKSQYQKKKGQINSQIQQQNKNSSSQQKLKTVQSQNIQEIFIRNTEWKQRVSDKIHNSQKQKLFNEMKCCTFKPQISDKKPTRPFNKSVSKEFQTEIKEIMNVIGDQLIK